MDETSKYQKKEEEKKEIPTLHTSYVALAATASTIITKSLLHPLDTIKCRLQSSTSQSWRFIWREYSGKWGPTYLYGGLPVKLIFYAPYQAIYMTTYNTAVASLIPEDASKDNKINFLTRTIAAASAAELASCIVRVPMETLKMRIQASVVPDTRAAIKQFHRNGFIACAKLILPQTLLHDIPYSAIQWICYETLRPWAREVLNKNNLDNNNNNNNTASRFKGYFYGFMRTFLTGSFSGLIASTITVPLDTIRTRVVVATAANPNKTIYKVIRETYQLGGVRIFFRGASTRILWVTTNMAVYFPLYETFKAELLRRQEEV